MKRTLLSVSVALACTVSHSAFAAGASDDSMSFWDEAGQFGGHAGVTYTFEEKTTTNYANYGGAKTVEKIHTKELLNLAYTNALWDFSALYGFSLVDGDTEVNGTRTEEQDGVSHTILLTKTFNFKGGWSGGIVYGFDFTQGQYEPTGSSDIDYLGREHTLKPYVNYWSNQYLAGVEFGVEYIDSYTEAGTKGTTDGDGYSLQLKPYKRYGNWEFAVQYYYQDKETDLANSTYNLTGKTDFTEEYFEPIVQYSFEDAGTLYARARIGEKESHVTNNYGFDAKYFEDIRKGTIGYQQLITQDFQVEVQYEFTDNEETSNDAFLQGDKKDIEQDKFYVSALYRF